MERERVAAERETTYGAVDHSAAVVERVGEYSSVTESWYCDTCDDEVSATTGLLIWKLSGEQRRQKSGFSIVHQDDCDDFRASSSVLLAEATGWDGQSFLTAMLSQGPMDNGTTNCGVSSLDEFVEIFRRLQLPGYEEARRYFRDPAVQEEFQGVREMHSYEQDILARIIELGRDRRGR